MKIAVVVDGDPIFFEGEKISGYYDDRYPRGILTINDVRETLPKKLGAFAKWDYWYYVSK